MKYRFYMESEFEDDKIDDLTPDMIVDTSEWLLDYEVGQYCKYLYRERDGWEWMKETSEKVVVLDEENVIRKFSFELDFEPTFYTSEVSDV